jgi:hypothetical protein
MIYCPHCLKPSAGKSADCPHCGGKLPRPKEKPKTEAYEKQKKDEQKTRKQASRSSEKNKEAQYAETQKQDKSKQEEPAKEKRAILKSADALIGRSQKSEAPKPQKKRLRLGETLVAAGILTNERLKTALEKQKELGLRLGTILVQENFINESQLVQALSHQADIRWIDITNIRISEKLLDLIPLNLAQNYLFVPIDTRETKEGVKVLFLAMDNPLDSAAVQAAQAASDMRIEPLFAAPSAIKEAIRSASGTKKAAPETKDDVWKLPENPSSFLEPVLKKPPFASDNVTQRQIIMVAHQAQRPSAAETPSKKEVVKDIVKGKSLESKGQQIQGENLSTTQEEKKPVPQEDKLLRGDRPRTLTFLDETTIQRTVTIQKGFSEPVDVFEKLLSDLKDLDDSPESVLRVKEYLLALLEILFRKNLIFPAELFEQLTQEKNEPQK